MADEARVLERLGLDQLVEDAELHLLVQLLLVAARLHPLPQPVSLVVIGDVHELYADVATVGQMQRVLDLTQRRERFFVTPSL